LFTREPARAADLSKTRANVVAALAKAEEEWLAASAALETA
jgi:ATP-binding cassette, subfamily F, member 3